MLSTGLFLLLLLSIGWSACTKTAQGITGPAGPKGPSGDSGLALASAINGYVRVFDQNGKLTASISGITVSTLKGDTVVSDTTDANGWFNLPGLTKGGYILSFHKSGLDSMEQYVVHSGGPEDKFLGNVLINESLTTTFSGIVETYYEPVFNDPYWNMFFSTAGTATSVYFKSYLSQDKNVNQYVYDIEQDFTQFESPQSYDVDVNPRVANGHAYNAGDTVYLKIYIVPASTMMTTWYNVRTGANVPYPYIGDSLSTNFIW